MWGELFTHVLGHALSRSIFKESPEARAARIAEEKRLEAERRRKERMQLIRGIPIIIVALLLAAGFLYFVWWMINQGYLQ